MHKFILLVCCFYLCGQSNAQTENQQPKGLPDFFRFTDFHIHPTYKHYFRYRTAKEMQLIVSTTKYNPVTKKFEFDPNVKKDVAINWDRYPKTKKGPLTAGSTSTLRNYDQSGYPQVMYTPGSVYCNSYSPYEKQFALKWIKRFISSKLVTGMGMSRLSTYGKNEHTPYHDFLAEYFYNLMQEEQQTVLTYFPDVLYRSRTGKTYHAGIKYYNAIKMVRDSAELDAITRANDLAFLVWNIDSSWTPHLVTPMVMSIEGAQVLYNTLSSKRKYILNPLNEKGKGKFLRDTADAATLTAIHKELLDMVDSVRNLPHRLFFITLGHFAQNHVVGFAKTLDRDPENFQHRAMSTITRSKSIRDDVIHKRYQGFNPKGDIGLKVVRAFLDRNLSREFHKPTYIDVKHMDIKARIQYYYWRRRYERDTGDSIPIIASHFSVSGENQVMAAATGLWPYFDAYEETERPHHFYRRDILRNGYKDETRAEHWIQHVMEGKPPKEQEEETSLRLDAFERGMYKPLNFLNDPTTSNEAYDPFGELSDSAVLSNPNIGWYYPWSINLFDEEIIEIDKSNGIIGLLMDPRQQGAFMPNYKEQRYTNLVNASFNRLAEDPEIKEAIEYYAFLPGEINRIDYLKTEPLLRNLFYIVRLISQQKDAEKNQNDAVYIKQHYPWFIPDSAFIKKDGWDLVSIGSDYDGLIDPIDYSPTAAYVPALHGRMIIYAYIFALTHADEFKEPVTNLPLIKSIPDSEEKMRKFFYKNGEQFIRKYF